MKKEARNHYGRKEDKRWRKGEGEKMKGGGIKE